MRQSVLLLFVSLFVVAHALPCTYLKPPVNFTIANDDGIMNGNTNGIFGRASWNFILSNITTPATFNNSIIDYTFCSNQTGLNLSLLINQLELVQPNVPAQTKLFSKLHNIFPGEALLYENGCIYGKWNFSFTSVPAMNNSYLPQLWASNRLFQLTIAKLYTNAPENFYVTTLTKPANLAPLPPPPANVQQVELRIDGDFSSITNKTQSCNDFLDDMAVFLKIDRARLTCVSVTAGSIIYTFTIKDLPPPQQTVNNNPDQPILTATQVANIIYTEASDPTSPIQDVIPGTVLSVGVTEVSTTNSTATTAPPTTATPTTPAPTTAAPTTPAPTTATPTTPAPTTYPLVVQVGSPTNTFSPSPTNATIYVNQTVQWVWAAGLHNVVSGSCPGGTCASNGNFTSGSATSVVGTTYTHTFTQAGNYSYYCGVHGSSMTGYVVVLASSTTTATPTTPAPTTPAPTTAAPTTPAPTTPAPTTPAPTTAAPTTAAPTTPAPTTAAPTTPAPTTAAPTTPAPTTAAPTTAAPTTAAPTTAAPTTPAPTTAAPTTPAPTTAAPTTPAPTTAAPTTAAPTTPAPTTAAPTTAAPTPTPAPTPAWGLTFGASNTATKYGSVDVGTPTYVAPTGSTTTSTVTDSQINGGADYVMNRVDNGGTGGCFYVTLGFPGTDFSKSIWVKLSSTGGYNNVFSTNSGAHTIYTPNQNAIFAATYPNGNVVTDTTAVSTTGTKWEHLAVTYSSTSLDWKLYRNGVLTATRANTAWFWSDTGTQMLIGAYGASYNYGYTGKVWKPEYHQIEMTAAQVKATYNAQCAQISGCVTIA